jgi:diguanylate cyclase (GGDEF)-like protein
MADDLQDQGKVAASPAVERKMRRLFWGSLLLSTIVALHFIIAAARGVTAGPLQPLLPAALLWSLVMTGYAFQAVSGLAGERARKKGFTDDRTGVFTLDYLKSCLEQERRRARENGGAGAVVLYVDMVRLDRVNRLMGYAVGDIVLKSVAQMIADSCRSGDIVGRVGGDEFLVIMPEASPQEAQEAVARIRQAIEDYELDLGKKGVIDYLSCKAGAARFPQDGETPEQIISVARERLAAAG